MPKKKGKGKNFKERMKKSAKKQKGGPLRMAMENKGKANPNKADEELATLMRGKTG